MAQLKDFLSFEIDISKTVQEADAMIAKYKQLKGDVAGVRSEIDKLKDRQRELQMQALKTDDTKAAKAYRKEAQLVGLEIKALTGDARKLDKEIVQLNKDFAGAKPAAGTYAELTAKLKQLQFERQNSAPIGSQRFDELTTETNGIIQQLKGLDAQVGQFQRNVGNYRNEIVNAFGDLGFADLATQQIAVVREEAEKARAEAIKLGNEYREALNQNSGKTEAELKAIKEAAEQAALAAGKATAQLEQLDNTSLTAIRNELKQAFSLQGIIKQGVGIAVSQLAVDSVLGGLSQGVNFLRDISKVQGEVARLNDSFTNSDIADITNDLRSLDTATGLQDLLKIAALGGQFGVAKKDVKGFTEAIDAVNVSLGDEFGGNVDEVTKQVGKLAVLYGDATKSIGENVTKTGSLLNEQSAKLTNVTAGFLADFALRVSGTAASLKLSLGDVAGIGSVLEQSGIGVERAGTATNTILSGLAKNFRLYAKELGLSAKETIDFKNLINTDANSALLFFLQRLKASSATATDFQAKLKDLKITGDGESASLLALVQNIDKVTEAQQVANKAFADGTSVTEEKTKALNSLDGILSRLENKLVNVLADPKIISGLETIGIAVIDLIDVFGKFFGYLQDGAETLENIDRKIKGLFKSNKPAPAPKIPVADIEIDPSAIKDLEARFKARQGTFSFKPNILADNTAQPTPEKQLKKIQTVSDIEEAAKIQEERDKKQKEASAKAQTQRQKETERIAEAANKRKQIELDTQNELQQARSEYQKSLLNSEQNFNDQFIELANARAEEVEKNKEAYDKDKTNLDEQLREKVLTKTQYNNLLAQLDETRRLGDLAAENEYNKKLQQANKARNETILSSRKQLDDSLIELQKTKSEGATQSDQRLIDADIVQQQLQADVTQQQAKIKDLELQVSLVPNDEALANALATAKIDLQNIVARAANETSGIIAEGFTADVEDGIAIIEERFLQSQNSIKDKAAADREALAAQPTDTEVQRQAVDTNEQSALLVNERAGLEARKALYTQYLATLANETELSAADREAIEKDLAEKIKGINNDIANSDRDLSAERVNIAEQTAEQRAKIEADEKEVRDAILSSVQQLESAAFELARSNTEADLQQTLSSLDEKKQKELDTFGTTQEKRAEIEARYAAKAKAATKAANEEKKSQAITQAIINGVLAVTDILAKNAGNPILAGVLIATTAALTAFNIAQIRRQQFRYGGTVGGERHEQGGTPIEAERGEGIVTRQGMSQYAEVVSTANQAGGGVRMPGTRGITDERKTLLATFNNLLRSNTPTLPNLTPTFVFLRAMDNGRNTQTDLTNTNELLSDIYREQRTMRNELTDLKTEFKSRIKKRNYA